MKHLVDLYLETVEIPGDPYRFSPEQTGLVLAALAATTDPSLVDSYADNDCPRFEGDVAWFYLDTERLVTIANGTMVPNTAAAQQLPMQKVNGMLASSAEIAVDFVRVAAMEAGHLSGHYCCAISLLLPKEARQALTRARCFEFVELLEREFPGFNSFPLDARLSLLDMIFNLGLERLRKYTNLYSAVRMGNWPAAAQLCGRDVHDTAFDTRNHWTSAHFLAAAQARPGVDISAAIDDEADEAYERYCEREEERLRAQMDFYMSPIHDKLNDFIKHLEESRS